MIQSFLHPIIEWLQTHKDKKGKALKKIEVMLFLSYSLTGASITVIALPRNRNTYTLLSVDNILQISLKTIFETSMGFKPRSSALAL